ncbi:MAG: TIGR03842 family LLM class F420-dependent oxidoreductase [Solirubrobacteraceae bacterium]
MEFGVVNIFPPAKVARGNLRLAERLGFDTFWVCDSHVIWNECYTLLGWLAGQLESSKIKLGTMVTNPVVRDPIVLSSAFATLQDVTSGRMMCGIGRGDSSVRVLNRHPGTIAALESAVNLIRGLTSGKAVDVDGSDVQLPWADGGAVPVFVGAYGPRAFRAAGRVGDGVVVECADPHFISWGLDNVRRGAEETGRDLSDFSVVVATSTFVSDDLDRARDEVRPVAALVGNHVAEVLRNTGRNSLPPEMEALVADRPEYDYHHHVRRDTNQSDYLAPEAVDRLCIAGSAERCAERLRELRHLGVTHVNFYAQTADFEDQMTIYSTEILPQLRVPLAHG